MTGSLFSDPSVLAPAPVFPRTRFLGSKRRLARAIVQVARDLNVRTVLDAFGGTGAVAHAFKCAGYAVTYNDVLRFNHQIGTALIENDGTRLGEEDRSALGRARSGVAYGDVVRRCFHGIYFTEEENGWLDVAVGNIRAETHPYRRAMLWFVLFQAAMAKRPYNLFHRCNLYMRQADVPRTFGNKASWDRSFDEHVCAMAEQANAALADSGGKCRATCEDAAGITPGFDLVYIDPPYVNAAGVGVDYLAFYHFLEGLVTYDRWEAVIDFASRHRRLRPGDCPWSDPRRSLDQFRATFRTHRDSVLLVSYRSDGIPSPQELLAALREVKPGATIVESWNNQYALSTRRQTREILLLGR